MMKNKIIFYFDQHPIPENKMKKIINSIIELAPNKIVKYGLSFKSMKLIQKVKIDVLVEIVLGYPKHSFGTLCLSDKNSDNNFYIEYTDKSFWRIEIDMFNSKVTTDFFIDFVIQTSPIYALLEDENIYIEKHLEIKKYESGGQSEKYVGFKFLKTIPGIYQQTFFRKPDFDFLNFNEIENKRVVKNGIIVKCTDNKSAELLKENLGSRYFFEKGNKEKQVEFPKKFEEKLSRY